MKAVFVDTKTFNKEINIQPIKDQVSELVEYPLTPESELVKRCLTADIIITNKVALYEETLRQLPQLKLICVAATGTNNIDLMAAKNLGIKVCNVSDYAGNVIAQYVFSQLLSHFQQIERHNQNTANGGWQNSETFCLHDTPIYELAGKTLGIIGYGNLGRSVATLATAFGMQVLVAERPNATNIRAGRLAFNEVIEQADIISLHCPLTADTKHLINSERLNQMKTSAVLINTARGGIVDSKALKAALINNQIGYAILDVLEQEPPPADHPLLVEPVPNLKITGHIAWASIEAQQRLINILASNITAFTSGQAQNVVS